MSKVAPVNEWQEAVLKHIKKLTEEEKREFAHKIIFDIVMEVGYNGYEKIGLLECIKLNLLDCLKNEEERREDCINHN